MSEQDFALNDLVAAVQTSRKYAQLSKSLIERIAVQELGKHKDLKTTTKAVRTRLHRLAGAFLQDNIDYAHWLDNFKVISEQDNQKHTDLCLQIMRAHASTKERLPFLEHFFTTTLKSIAPIRSILDLACGLNPLAIPFMPLSTDAIYQACDVVEPMINFLQEWFTLRKINGTAYALDLLEEIPQYKSHVTFILKTLPILDQVEPSFSSQLLDKIASNHILISYPSRSLGGRSKGMEQTYTGHFNQLVSSRNFQIQRFDFPNEIAFLLSR